MQLATLQRNIRKIYKLAQPEHLTQGKIWYKQANQFCQELADQYNIDLAQVVGCLAVLSPNCSWEINKKACVDMLALSHCPNSNVYPANVAKAYQIVYEGIDPVEILGKPNRYGNKVRAFYDNILRPKCSVAVTVDTHAIRAALGRYEVTINEQRQVFGTKTGYLRLQEAYTKVARSLDLLPCELQAIVWLSVKHFHA